VIDIRKSLIDDMADDVAISLVQSRLDYANSLLYGISKNNPNKLQRVHNYLARIVIKRHPLMSSNGLLSELHWLPIHRGLFQFYTSTLIFRVLSS